MPKDKDPIKSFLDVRSQSHISINNRLSLSSDLRSLSSKSQIAKRCFAYLDGGGGGGSNPRNLPQLKLKICPSYSDKHTCDLS